MIFRAMLNVSISMSVGNFGATSNGRSYPREHFELNEVIDGSSQRLNMQDSAHLSFVVLFMLCDSCERPALLVSGEAGW